MQAYEYKVMPAPTKGRKAPGVKGPEARFSLVLQDLMNEMGAQGWEYQRADILPSEERQGLTSSHTVYRSVLVFRRGVAVEEPEQSDPAPAIAEIDVSDKETTASEEELIQPEPPTETEERSESRD